MIMKKIAFIAAGMLAAFSAFAQPQLSADNIDEIIKAMTLEEKVTLLVGGSRAVNINGVPSGTTNLVPGAAGVTRAVFAARRGKGVVYILPLAVLVKNMHVGRVLCRNDGAVLGAEVLDRGFSAVYELVDVAAYVIRIAIFIGISSA